MRDLAPLLRLWRALDARFERVAETPWGAVVTDRRFPEIWDVNYARVEVADARLTLAEIESALLPEVERAGARHVHIVLFHPEEVTGALVEASSRGDRLAWDAVMELRSSVPAAGEDVPVEEVRDFGDQLWRRLRASLAAFGVTSSEASEQMVAIEREVMLPAGKRWFAVRDGRVDLAYGSLLAHEGIGHVDHVVTFPEARRRGFATAIVRRIVAEAAAAGVERLFLLAEPGSRAHALYERLGFVTIAQLASTLRPLA